MTEKEVKQAQVQIELTPKADDKDPHRKKQQKAIGKEELKKKK